MAWCNGTDVVNNRIEIMKGWKCVYMFVLIVVGCFFLTTLYMHKNSVHTIINTVYNNQPERRYRFDQLKRWGNMLQHLPTATKITTNNKLSTDEDQYSNYLHNISIDEQRLQQLALHSFLVHPNLTLLTYMKLVASQPQCMHKPLFIAMAHVQSDLYWQLIQNFIYSMMQFDHIECSIMICVTDMNCMNLCRYHHFPCYHYQHPNATTGTTMTIHIMEQIATIKLLEVSRALEAGLNILLLDLDVGFLRDPLVLYEGFLDDEYEQIR